MNIAILAMVWDALLGDPKTRWHPVALIGKLIMILESLLYREKDSDRYKMLKGMILAIVVLILSDLIPLMILKASSHIISWKIGQVFFSGFLLSFTICPKSLAQAGKKVYALLVLERLYDARQAVSMIVGRETKNLDEEELTRATIETIAENTVDGIIAPLFFFFIGGVPLAYLYRAVNTLDSMLGYKNDRYLYFGRASARIDDVFGLIPARLTGMLFVASAWILGFDWRFSCRMMKRDARKHPSPNGGFAEASMAGALHIRLGGFNTYFGKKTFRAYMGEPIQPLMRAKIMEAIRMMYTASILFLMVAYAVLYACGYR
jgi:adenosylcobinamide-phosphate synthase